MSSFNPVPKPVNKKKKKKVNGWKDKSERMCFYCGTYGAERHEIYGGPNRQTSIDMGFQIDLCPNCHRSWHEQKKDIWIKRREEWQKHYQQLYENKLISSGITPKQARDCWMHLIGRNYLDTVY